MHGRSMNSLLVLVFIFSLGFSAHIGDAHGQSATGVITILDRTGAHVQSLVDGDLITLQATLPETAAAEQQVSFRLAGSDYVLAGCSIPSGGTSCTSDPLEALGWYWSESFEPQKIRVVEVYNTPGELLGSSAEINVSARPVVMVHGFSSNFAAWNAYLGAEGYLAELGIPAYAVGDGQVPGTLNTGNIADPSGRTNSIAENASIVNDYVAAVRQQTGAEQVDLLAHSMGGLISRYYIDRFADTGQVRRLIMLGSPMAGTACANLPAALGYYLPATLELRPSYITTIFNSQVTQRKGVAFHDLAGVPIVDPIQSPCTEVPTDIAVSLPSVNAIPLEVTQMPLLHTSLNTEREVFESFVRPLLTTPPGGFTRQPDPPVENQGGAVLQFSRVRSGHVNPGQTVEIEIPIESGVAVASFALYDPTRSLQVQVRGASGNEIVLSAEKNGLIQVDDPETLVYLGYGFNDPRPGLWRVSLSAGPNTPAQGADFALTTQYQGGVTLQAALSSLLPAAGEEVVLSAQLSDGAGPLQVQSAGVVVRNSDGGEEDLELSGSADGLTARWTAAQPGLHAIDVLVQGVDAEGSPFERSLALTLEVPAPPAGPRGALLGVGLALGVAGGLGALGLLVIRAKMRRAAR
jgi:pimeloyl-ACP methyl ester carboxylesterase